MQLRKLTPIVMIFLLLASLTMAGCEQQTAQEAGKKVGEAVKKMEKGIDEAGEAIKEGAEDFKEGYREAN